MPGRIDFTMGFNAQNAAYKIDSDTSYRIYILGSFSGESGLAWQQRNIKKIDIDNIEQVMGEFLPTLTISSELKLSFKTMDDFHPDIWLEKVKLLAELQQLKKQVSNPQSAAQAAAKIQAYFPTQAPNDRPEPVQQTTESQDDMLERLLGKKPESTHATSDSLAGFIDQIVSPYVTKDADPEHLDLINLIDASLSQILQSLLHRSDFQHLEALWKATAALVNEESADEQSIFLVDISQAELLAELKNDSHAFKQKLLKHVQLNEGEQDVLLISNYCFADTTEDRALLNYCSRLANTVGGYFLGAADDSFIANLGYSEPNNVQTLTQYLNEINADRVVLAYPRYLIRLPYGKKRDPIDAFEFEECSAIPQSDELLWGSSAFLCARVLIKNSTTADAFLFSDIPAFTFAQDGESILQPGVETVLTEKQANALLSLGISPVLGFRQRQGVRVLSIAMLSGSQ